MATVTKVELPKGSSGSKFSASAEWWEDRSHFAVVRFYKAGVEAFALRMDLDKRVFLDRAPDDDIDKDIRSRMFAIWADVINAKRASSGVKPLSA